MLWLNVSFTGKDDCANTNLWHAPLKSQKCFLCFVSMAIICKMCIFFVTLNTVSYLQTAKDAVVQLTLCWFSRTSRLAELDQGSLPSQTPLKPHWDCSERHSLDPQPPFCFVVVVFFFLPH